MGKKDKKGPLPAPPQGAAAPAEAFDMVFHCQLAHGSPTKQVKDFTNVKQLYESIAKAFGIATEDVSLGAMFLGDVTCYGPLRYLSCASWWICARFLSQSSRESLPRVGTGCCAGGNTSQPGNPIGLRVPPPHRTFRLLGVLTSFHTSCRTPLPLPLSLCRFCTAP